MGDKKYFFRNNEYTYMEMLKRIPVEVLAEEVIQEKGLSQNKCISKFLDNFNQSADLTIRLSNSFQYKGRKGDVANIKIYNFMHYKCDILTEDGIRIINTLVGKKINDLVLLGTFLEGTLCYMEDIKIYSNNNEYIYMDYKLKFQYEIIMEDNGNMKKELRDSFVEARHYVKEGILATIDSTMFELKSVANVIFTIPYYVNIELGNQATYLQPDYEQIKLNSIQLQSIKILLGGYLRYTILNMKGDKGVVVKIEGNDKNFEKNSTTLKQNMDKGDNKEVQFYWKDENGMNNKITIKDDCQIISTNYLSEQALKKIIDVILLVNGKKELLIPMGRIIEKYCALSFRKSLRKSAYNAKMLKIAEEINSIVSNIASKNSININLSELYCTISINILIQSLKTNKRVSEKMELDIKSYELYSVIKVYVELDNITETDFMESINVLAKCIKVAGGEESKLMDTFYSLI